MLLRKYPAPRFLRWFAAFTALALTLAEKLNSQL